MNDVTELSQKLQDAANELDYSRVSWIDKVYIIDLNRKANVLLSSLLRFENENEQGAVIEAANNFLITVEPVIAELKKV